MFERITTPDATFAADGKMNVFAHFNVREYDAAGKCVLNHRVCVKMQDDGSWVAYPTPLHPSTREPIPFSDAERNAIAGALSALVDKHGVASHYFATDAGHLVVTYERDSDGVFKRNATAVPE